MRFCSAFLFAWILILPAFAGDWPQILGPGRDGQTDGETIAVWDKPPEMRWKVPCGAGYAGAAVVGDKVFLWHRIGREELLDCLNTKDGKQIWRSGFEAVYRGGVDADQGPRCVPVVDGNRVFVYGAAGDLHAVNINDGKPIWTRKLRTQYDAEDGYFGAGSTPLVVGKMLIAAIGGRNGAGVVALDIQDGKTRWTASDEDAAYASPVTMQLDNKPVVVAVMGLRTLLLDLESGKIVRQFDFGRRGPVVNAATPLVDGSRLFVTASYGIGCRMVDLKTETPTDIWQSRDVISSQYASPVRSGDYLYAITGRQDMGDAGLLCVRWADGKTTWTKPGFGTGHLIVGGDRVLAQLTDGRLDLFAADPTAYKQLATADLPPGGYKSLPAFSGGTLFCRRSISSTEGELIALQW